MPSELLRSVAAHGLSGTELELPKAALPDGAFHGLQREVRDERLGGPFWAAISSGALPVTRSQLAHARRLHHRSLAGVLALDELLLHSILRLQRAGIPHRALKGSAVAHLDYPDAAQRLYGDVDLLVPAHLFDEAIRVLSHGGGRRRYPEPRPGFDRRFGKGVCVEMPNGLELDLHRTFSMGPFGVSLDLEALWSRPQSFSLACVTIDALPVEARAVEAAYQAVLGNRGVKLVPLRDLAQIILAGDLDLDRLRALMRASDGEAVVARAVREAWHHLGIADVLAITAWAEEYIEDRRNRTALASYGTDSTYAGRSFATIRALTSWSDRTRFVTAMVLPQRSYLEGRHRNRLSRLRTGAHEIATARQAR